MVIIFFILLIGCLSKITSNSYNPINFNRLYTFEELSNINLTAYGDYVAFVPGSFVIRLNNGTIDIGIIHDDEKLIVVENICDRQYAEFRRLGYLRTDNISCTARALVEADFYRIGISRRMTTDPFHLKIEGD